MAHHKRKGPKSARAGCLLCKPHKRLGAAEADRLRASQQRETEGQAEALRSEGL